MWARHAINVNQYRWFQHCLPCPLGSNGVIVPLQGKLIGQISRLLPSHAALLQDKEASWLSQAMVRRPHCSVQHPLNGLFGDWLVLELPGHAAVIECLINANLSVGYDSLLGGYSGCLPEVISTATHGSTSIMVVDLSL
jgi:hypothetical protein